MMAFNWFPWSAKQLNSERGLMVSFPKSGRTWVRVMLDSVNCKLRYTHDGSDHSLGTHFSDLVPCQVDGSDLPLLFLHRDPRDTAVSGFFSGLCVFPRDMTDRSVTLFEIHILALKRF